MQKGYNRDQRSQETEKKKLKLNIRCDNTVKKIVFLKIVYILYLVAETECMRSTEFSVENKNGIIRLRKMLMNNRRSIGLLVEIKGL